MFNKLTPLKGSSSHAYFVAKGLDTHLLDTYHKSLQYSEEWMSPVFIFRDLYGVSQIARSLSNQDSPKSKNNSPAYFYCHEIGPPCLVDQVHFFKDPIELMSYLQIKYPVPNRILCLAAHPLSPITGMAELTNYFPNARFVSFIPNASKPDILLNLKLSLALAGKNHRLNINGQNLQLTIEGKTLNYRLSELRKDIIPFVKRKKQQPVLFKSPPKNYQSFNSILNDRKQQRTNR